jgi:hypothetical protein
MARSPERTFASRKLTSLTRIPSSLALTLGATALVGGVWACSKDPEDPALSKKTHEIPVVASPPANGPKLGALAEITPILERPAKDAPQLGYLHAGAKVARAEEPYSLEGCVGGWYPVRPRGFVCAGEQATTDMSHPTLIAMALGPKLELPLPYAYGRTKAETRLFARDPKRDDAVVEVRKLPRRSGMAVVGSWEAVLPGGKTERLGLLPSGLFVQASALTAAAPSTFQGVALDGKTEASKLPIAFVVKRGVHPWKARTEDKWDSMEDVLPYHEILPLTGRFRTGGGTRYWALSDGRWVRYRDVTVVLERHNFPEFAKGDQKWIDVSIVAGSAVFYEGQRAVYVTLVSVGRDRDGDPKLTQSTAQGDFEVVGKHVTAAKLDPRRVAEGIEVLDVPWTLELSSGQLMFGAYWHDRFGVEFGPGHIQLAPADARWVWQWATPSLPDYWHGVNRPAASEKKTIVRVRK